MKTMAGGLGFEPRLTESESAVLPLDDPPRAWDAKAHRSAQGLTPCLPRRALACKLQVVWLHH